MVTGRVEQGVVKVGEEVEVVGLRTVWKTILISLIVTQSKGFPCHTLLSSASKFSRTSCTAGPQPQDNCDWC